MHIHLSVADLQDPKRSLFHCYHVTYPGGVGDDQFHPGIIQKNMATENDISVNGGFLSHGGTPMTHHPKRTIADWWLGTFFYFPS